MQKSERAEDKIEEFLYCQEIEGFFTPTPQSFPE
jgi:hypothetical protein